MRRILATALACTAGLATTLVVAAPAQARPSCTTHVRNITVAGRKVTQLYITGGPYRTDRTHAFRLRWGWKPNISTYTPTYRTHNVPRHVPVWHARGWVNGITCIDWHYSTIFPKVNA